jgi:hypothetical protein
MSRISWLVGMVVSAAVVSGCVDRRYVVTTSTLEGEPLSAVVFRNNNQSLGPTPADDHFTYYGKYHFTIVADGFQTLQVDQDIPAPWYQYFPIDFFADILPYRIEDVRRFHYKLEPLQTPDVNQLLNQGQALRNQGKSLGTPPPPAPITAQKRSEPES